MALCDEASNPDAACTSTTSAVCGTTCTGTVTPPVVIAECTAQVAAVADIETICDPPLLEILYTFQTVPTGLGAQDAFTTWLTDLRSRFARVLALQTKLGITRGTAANLITAAGEAMRSAVESSTLDEDTLNGYRVNNCVPPELDAALTILSGAVAGMTAPLAAVTELINAVDDPN